MGTSQVHKAMQEYDEVVKKATREYEATLRDAEAKLRNVIINTEPEPPPTETITMSAKEHADLMEKMQVMAKFIAQNPHLQQD